MRATRRHFAWRAAVARTQTPIQSSRVTRTPLRRQCTCTSASRNPPKDLAMRRTPAPSVTAPLPSVLPAALAVAGSKQCHLPGLPQVSRAAVPATNFPPPGRTIPVAGGAGPLAGHHVRLPHVAMSRSRVDVGVRHPCALRPLCRAAWLTWDFGGKLLADQRAQRTSPRTRARTGGNPGRAIAKVAECAFKARAVCPVALVPCRV